MVSGGSTTIAEADLRFTSSELRERSRHEWFIVIGTAAILAMLGRWFVLDGRSNGRDPLYAAFGALMLTVAFGLVAGPRRRCAEIVRRFGDEDGRVWIHLRLSDTELVTSDRLSTVRWILADLDRLQLVDGIVTLRQGRRAFRLPVSKAPAPFLLALEKAATNFVDAQREAVPSSAARPGTTERSPRRALVLVTLLVVAFVGAQFVNRWAADPPATTGVPGCPEGEELALPDSFEVALPDGFDGATVVFCS